MPMAERGGVMEWDEWSARHVEREFVVPKKLRMKANPKAQEEVQVEMSPEVSGQNQREEVLKHTKKALEERRRHW